MNQISRYADHRSRRVFHYLTILAALCFVLQVVVGVVGVPRALTRWLKCAEVPHEPDPAWIIVLGGSGIPSPPSLIRSYYGAQSARAHPEARCIVALPAAHDPLESSVGRMREELIIRGVSPDRILMEHVGQSTYEQAVNTAGMLDEEARREPVMLVTSPYHMRRAYLCFRKAGFERVGCLPAHSTGSDEDYRRAQDAWSGPPTPGMMIANLRYGFWSNLTAEIWIVRELLGLGVYKLRGWI